jgi:hypothetical protein
MYSVGIHHSHGHYVSRILADSPGDAYVAAREAALAEGLILYRVIVLRGPYGLPGGA